MDNYDKLLPVGSVIVLKGTSRRILIIGTLIKEEGGTIYNYMGCPYPEGFVNSEQLILFNHDKIAEISFIGFINAEYQLHRSETIEELKKLGLTTDKKNNKASSKTKEK